MAGHIHLAVQLLALPGVGLAGGRHHHGTGRELLQLRQSEAGYVSLEAGRVRVVVTVDLVTDGVDVDSTNDLEPGGRVRGLQSSLSPTFSLVRGRNFPAN